MAKFFRSAAFPILIIILLAFFVQQMIVSRLRPKDMNFQEFVQKVKNDEIKSVEIEPKDQMMNVVLKDGDSKTSVGYIEDYPLTQLLLDNDVSFTSAYRFVHVAFALISALPILVIVVFWLFLMNQMQGGGNKVMSFGKSRAKRMSVDEPKITFKDVAGVDEAVEELQEIKEFLENPKEVPEPGRRDPQGRLCSALPAPARRCSPARLPGEAGVPFFSICGSDFVEMFVGVGASACATCSSRPRRTRPASSSSMRSTPSAVTAALRGIGGGHDEREQTLNQLLVEMDGFETKDSVIMIAATNRPDILDPALLARALRPADRRRSSRPHRARSNHQGAHAWQAVLR